MKRALNKILLSTMIIAFMWVIIGDLVNMHMKLIYKKDLTEHNTYYTKSHKSDKKDYLLSGKDIKKLNDFANTQDNSFNFKTSVSYYTLLITKTVNFNSNNLFTSLLLRGPPSFI